MKRWGRICHPVISKGWEMHYIMIDKWLPLLPESVQSFDRAMLEREGKINRIDEVVQPQPRKERHLESSWNKTPDNIEFKASRPSPVRLPFFGRPALP
ncbi:hypothetical protein F9C07_2663 [Aspergillus flavus]|uniref:Uncharacterized protein n=1 Tax=Aspergillus flavus (strain ATCC 200026 / FGSC A1120 / IAM 13836 / NRRL 3357 / JCM 12722 / SRRC 167) TaxID=332952 RepID=A0A7U2MER7_ASPFN|nr:hypothetical protein F9C07_2663 [Aspergillus flavus]